jgi:UDP-3-O-[3-hydroxymyristoyl] N-acetylglucosamine deacetylase
MNRATIARDVTATGTALHAGVTVTMTLSPAPAGQGVVFRRADLGGKDIPARHDLVGQTRLGTVIAQGGASVGVIEHLMAAVAGAAIDDLVVTLDGPEPPILDGDALSYLLLLEEAGRRDQGVPRHVLEIRKPVSVNHEDARASLSPGPGSRYEFEIEFSAPAIGRQTFALDLTQGSFRDAIAPARTFGFLKELEGLRKMNLAKGANLENTLALDDNGVVNAGLMRFADEFVRHKILDAIGDMALAGAPLRGLFGGHRSGHTLNNALLRALFADPANYALVEL